MENIKKLLIVESVLALVLLSVIMHLFITGGLSLTGNVITTSDSEINSPTDDQMNINLNPVYVSNIVPADSSYNQGVYSNIIVTFSDQMSYSTVNSGNFIVSGPNNIALAGTITPDFTRKIWTFNPIDSLKPNTQYTITLTTGLKGITGNVLLKNYVFGFTTNYYYSGGGGGSGGGSTPTPAPLVLTTISLTPILRNISIGNVFQLIATGLDQNSNPFITTINYTSSNESIATVNSSGIVTALSIGNTTITSSNGAITNSSLVVVVEAVISSIDFSFASKNSSVGNDFQLDVGVYDQNQDPINAIINYTSSNESVATVNSSGIVTALSIGNTTITASNGSINDTFVLNLFDAVLTSINLTSSNETLALGNATQLITESFDQFNFPIDVGIEYVSNDTSVATVNSSGYVNTTGVGTVIITASNETVSKNVTLFVYLPVLTKIELTPTFVSLLVGASKQLIANGFDQNNNILSTIINYTSSNESIVTVNSSGFINAIAQGNATITASNGSVINSSLIEVLDVSGCPVVSVNLGTAGDFVILSKTGISTTGVTSIVGDIGVSPIDHTAITGFGLIGEPTTDTFLTSALVTGEVYAANLFGSTPVKMTTAIGDMGTAYTTSNGLAACVNELGAGDIGGMTLPSGVYKWSSDLNIPTDVILSGTATDVWVFQISGKLDLASAVNVNLVGGAQAKNIYWVVEDVVTLGTTSVLNGNILAKTNIDMKTGATLNGRALAQTAVTLDANAVTIMV